ncbi:MAG: 2-oxoglutarate dehydrogenase complex dihydrolipoyllysine-residue succinyltransferase [Litorilinea sp.]
MTTEVLVPALGESVVEATVAKWLKQKGDTVEAGEAIVSLETDKVDLDVPATQRGVLQELRYAEGDDVQVGDVLAVIEGQAAGEASAAADAPTEDTPTEDTPAEDAPEQDDANASDAAAEDAESSEGRAERATPVAKRVAADKGVDLAQVEGAGPGGRVTRRDVEQFAAGRTEKDASPPATKPAAKSSAEHAASEAQAAEKAAAVPETPKTEGADGGARREERVRMSRRRRTIADRLVEAQRTAAILTTFNDVDMQAIMEVRKRRRDSFRDRHGVGLGFMSFFVKATIGALKVFPALNGAIDGNEIVLKHYYDIGIAVGAEEGLVVPVLRDADHMTFAQIEQTIGDYVGKVQAGTLALEDLRGGTFTISNGGVFGSLLSTPILNPPQVGILGMHRIEERPVVRNGEIVIRPMMYLAVSYDHRMIDGQEAVRFLGKMKELLEDPEALLLEG